MNHVYRLVWSHRRNGWVAVSEIARGRKKGSGRKLTLAALSLTAAVAQAGPSGGQVVSGTGQISSSGNTTTITQSSQNLSLTWQAFNIAPQETVDFVQPSASAIAVNHILGNNGTQILGHLNANGQVYLINPNGILFGPGSQVDVGGLVASTLDASAASPGGSSRSFSGSGTGSVTNEGTITAVNGGYVVLLGNRVSNLGTIVAQLGTVGFGAGSAVTLTFSGDTLVGMQVDRSTLNNLAANGGLIQADGGRVIMTAGARDALLASVVNNTGVIEARTVEDHDGTITLLGGMTAGQVNVGGTLDASAPNGGNGGDIETSAAHVSVADSARVTTAAPKGLTGSWMVDPQDFTVAASGGDITGSALSGELATTNVQLQSSSGANAGSGNVNVNDPVTWSANTTLTLTASNNVNINANIAATGATAGLVIAPNTANGSEAASGTGAYTLNNGSSITLSGATPSLSIAGHAYTVINSLGVAGSTTGTDLQGIAGNLSGHYALGSNIDASSTASWNSGKGFAPLGQSTSFTGVFDGLGHAISDLTVDTTASYVGLFGKVSANSVIQNVGLVGGSFTGRQSTGALVGDNAGTINNSYATSTVNGNYYVGGLVGVNYGTISNSHATGAVTNASYSTGGLVGSNGTASKQVGSIYNSYATGAVSATAAAVGGLAGISYGTIANSYATGSATSLGSNRAETGGLVGAMGKGTVTDSYSTGAVSAQYQDGGLVGRIVSGSVTNSYWDTTTSGMASSAGGTGLTTVQMQTAANFSGFNFTTTPSATGNEWVMVDGNGTLNNSGGAAGATFPMLASEYATTITNAHQLQLMAMAVAASYSLGADIDASATAGTSDVWSTTGGFSPVGPTSAAFSGTFNGVGHTISDLYIVTNPQNGSGMFGASTGTIENVGLVNESMTGGSYRSGGLVGENGGLIQNSYVTGSVIAGYYTGGVAGTNRGTISNSYSTASVAGIANTGGLVGANYGSITGSYATGSVNAGGFRVGGLVGANFYNTTISNSYATGAVNGGVTVGGLVGGSYGPITDSYATGLVTGSSAVGGLIGTNHVANTITNSFWNVTTTGQATSSVGGTGLTTAQMQQQSSFTGWDFTGTWIVYSGYSNPLLRSFMTPLTVTASDAGETYNGLAYSGGNGATYSMTPNGNLLGSLTYTGSAQGAINVGSYALTPQGLYSNQQGYIISYAGGSLTINPAPLTVSGTSVSNKVYDGTTAATLAGGTLSGVIGSDTVGLSQAGTFASANVGTGIAVSAADALTGTAATNYILTQPTGLSGNITPATLTVNGTNVANKVYDSTTAATLTGGTLSGIIGSDSVTLTQAGAFTSANAGTGIAVNASDTLSGTAAGNYIVSQPTGLSANITPATLTVNGTSVANKVYDGTTAATLAGGALSGVIGSDSVTLAQSGTFASANAGTGIAVSASDALTGTAAANYTLTQPTGLSANITPATLTVNGTSAANKVYDGTTAATLAGGTLSGVIGSDSVTLAESGTFASANAGTGIAVSASDALTGIAAANYTLTQPTGLSANITPATLTVSGTSVANKVYDGTTAANLTAGTLFGVIGSDAVTLAQAGTFASANAGTGIAVTASDTLGGVAAANYVLIQPTGLSTNITPATLTVGGTSVANKVYDGTTAATLASGTLSGVIGSDSVTLTQSGTFASHNVGTAIAVSASDALTGTAAANYTLTQPTGLSANITPATLTVGGTNVANKVYDGTTTATLTGGTLSGVIGSDSVALTQAGAFAAANTGTGIAVNASDALSGAGAGNYTLTQPTGLTANITPATLTYVALLNSTSAGKLVSGLSGTVSGFVPGDTLANSTSGSSVWTTNATDLSPPGSYAIDGGGLTSGNYIFAQAPGNATALTVGAAPITPPPVAWVESTVLVAPGNSTPSVTSTSLGSSTLSVSSTSPGYSTPPASSTPAASSAPQDSAAPATTGTVADSGSGTSGSDSGNSTPGKSGGYVQVSESTPDFGGGKLHIENGGVRLPDDPPGAH